MTHSIVLLFTSLLLLPSSSAWQCRTQQPLRLAPLSSSSSSDDTPIATKDPSTTRRSLLLLQSSLALALLPLPSSAAPPPPTALPNLTFLTTPSGLQYADVKPGTGTTSPTPGSTVSIDYVMSTTGARYGSKIYSTQDAGAPYRWTLGDGSTIPGLEEAVMTMTAGGIRRVILPAKLAYQANSVGENREGIIDECVEGKGLGPVPPQGEALGEFQRFKNIYCNPDRMYQPDLVMDVKLYGKR